MNATTIGAFEAKTHLSQLLDRVEKGEHIEITRRGHPVARLVPYDQPINNDRLRQLASRVKEERGSYRVATKDIHDWKKEGRR
jgi:prevent-host-death family protein